MKSKQLIAAAALATLGLSAGYANAHVSLLTNTLGAWPTFQGSPDITTYSFPTIPNIDDGTRVPETFASSRGVMQTFTATSDFTLGAVTIRALGGGSNTDVFSLHLFDVTAAATLPGSYTPGTQGPNPGVDLLTGPTFNYPPPGSSDHLLTFNFGGADRVNLINGRQYALEVWGPANAATPMFWVRGSGGISTYTGGDGYEVPGNRDTGAGPGPSNLANFRSQLAGSSRDLVMAVYSSVNAPPAPPILRVDLNGGGANHLRPTQSGHTGWSSNGAFTTLPTSGNGAAPDPDGGYPTNTITRAFGAINTTLTSVDVTTAGTPAYVNDDARLNSRDQGAPADGGSLTTGNLLRDFVMAEVGNSTANNGTNHRMEIKLEGLTANKTYKVTFYSYNHFNNKGAAVFTDVTANPLVNLRAANAGGAADPTLGDGTGATQYAPVGQTMYSPGGVATTDTERAVTLTATADATGKLIFAQTTVVGLAGASETLPVLNGFVIDEFVTPTWSAASPANWGTGASWSTGAAPNAKGEVASFTSNTANHSVTVAAPVTVGGINFAGATSYTIGGGSTITLDDTSASSVATIGSGRGRAFINLASGSHTISAPVLLANDTTVNVPFNTTLTLSNLQPSSMQLVKNDIGTLQVNNLRLDTLQNWSHIVRVLPDSGPNGVSNLRTLDLGTGGPGGTPTGKLDLTNNKLVTQDALGTWNGTRYTGVTGMVQSGRNPETGVWDGNGIVTSMTDATTSVLTTIAVASGAEIRGLGPTDTDVWAGQTINGDSSLVMYTWGGDADLNGELNGDDYFFIDSNVLQSGSVFGFHQGDFDYNGEINGDDYFILDSNILQAQGSAIVWYTGSGGSGLASVPEPASAGLIVAAGAGLLRRRRKV